MDLLPELQTNTSIPTQETLLAASTHDIPGLRLLLRQDESLVNTQDLETGFTPLHAAIAACEDDEAEDEPTVNGHANLNGTPDHDHDHSIPNAQSASTVDKAKATVQWLLQQGAIWNQLDANDETPGCMAWRLGLQEIYAVMVDAGTRAELLLGRLEEYEQLAGDDSEDDEDQDEDEAADLNIQAAATATGDSDGDAEVAENNQSFLRSELTFQPDVLLDRDANGVMMSWETDIMQKTADLLLLTEGLRVLNIGHGMGIIDGILQTKKPVAHHIIEAHPDVQAQMKRDGWHERAGVVVHEGRWQDVVPKLIEEGTQFDAVFFDTFAEDYRAFKILFEEHLVGFLDDTGKWSFFNGLGADRQVSYDVYKNILSMDLQESGYEIGWTELEVPDLASQGTWEGTKRPYWTLKKYHLAICSFFS